MNWKNQRVFISGGAGVIGKELVQQLSDLGARIFVGDLKSRPKEFKQTIIYRRGDLNYIEKTEIEYFKPTIFIHLAATFERTEENYDFWQDNFWHNVRLSNHLMGIFKDVSSLRKVIFASSYLIYNENQYLFKDKQNTPAILNEGSTISPRNLTGSAKLNHEIELDFIKKFKPNIRIVNARIFRSYGIGSRDVISRWVRLAIQGKKIDVYQPENMFDFIYAGDVALGLIKLTESNYQGAINLASGKSHSIAEVIDVLMDQFPNLMIHKKHIENQYEASQANVKELQRVTKWVPNTNIKKGISLIRQHELKQQALASTKQNNLLVTSLSKKIPLIKSIQFSISKLGFDLCIFGGDLKNDALGKYFVDRFWKMPKTSDSNLNKILNYCKKQNISMIIPTRDGELEFWAKNKTVFAKENILVMVSTIQTVRNMLDKFSFYKNNLKLKLPIIPTYESIDDVKSKKYVVKERFGAGSRSIALNINKNKALEHAKKLENPIFQPFILGAEYSVDAYIDIESNIQGLVVRKRDLVVNGESQITTTLRHSKIEKVARKFIKSFDFYGHIILQVLEDNGGKIHIIECNPRFGGASTASLAAGMRTFEWFILESLGEKLEGHPFIDNIGVKQIRYPQDKIV